MKDLFYPILKRREKYRTTGRGTYYANYSEYKQEIREDCLGRCIYCDIHENEVGGSEHMNLDHFRPKTYDEFKNLENDPNNLVWTCRGCNRLKSDHWPALGTEDTVLGEEGFIDRFNITCDDYLQVQTDGKLLPLKPPAKYMITILALNRTTRARIRELRYLKAIWVEEFDRQIREFQDKVACLSPEDQQKFLPHLEWLKGQRAIIAKFLDLELH